MAKPSSISPFYLLIHLFLTPFSIYFWIYFKLFSFAGSFKKNVVKFKTGGNKHSIMARKDFQLSDMLSAEGRIYRNVYGGV